jgi:hypothetical protein
MFGFGKKEKNPVSQYAELATEDLDEFSAEFKITHAGMEYLFRHFQDIITKVLGSESVKQKNEQWLLIKVYFRADI